MCYICKFDWIIMWNCKVYTLQCNELQFVFLGNELRLRQFFAIWNQLVTNYICYYRVIILNNPRSDLYGLLIIIPLRELIGSHVRTELIILRVTSKIQLKI